MRMTRPSRIDGIRPVRTSSYARLRPIPNKSAASLTVRSRLGCSVMGSMISRCWKYRVPAGAIGRRRTVSSPWSHLDCTGQSPLVCLATCLFAHGRVALYFAVRGQLDERPPKLLGRWPRGLHLFEDCRRRLQLAVHFAKDGQSLLLDFLQTNLAWPANWNHSAIAGLLVQKLAANSCATVSVN